MQSVTSIGSEHGGVVAAPRSLRSIGVIVAYEALAASFLFSTIKLASTTGLGFDEVLAVSTARLPKAADVVAAIWQGAEFSPPTYDLLLHGLFALFGSSLLVARLPSIVAVLICAVAIGRLVAGRLGTIPAALAFGLVLNSSLFEYADQARPYAVMMAAASIALLLWNACTPAGPNRTRAIGIALMLFACMSLHFYAVAIVAVFGLMEALWFVAHRRIRLEIWLAYLASGALAALVWGRLALHLAAFNGTDAKAPGFYGAPTLSHLVDHTVALLLGSKVNALLVLATIGLAGAAFVAASLMPRRQGLPRQRDDGATQIGIIAVALLASLPLGFSLALAVTHVFSARYALLASIGAVLLLTLALERMRHGAIVSAALLPVLCVLPLLHPPVDGTARQAQALLQGASGSDPIVVGDGWLFLQLLEAVDAETRERLVFLTRPGDAIATDPTTENQIKRLLTFLPKLPVADPVVFVAAHPRFLALCRPGVSGDAVDPWFVSRHWVVGILGMDTDVSLFEIKPRGADAQRP